MELIAPKKRLSACFFTYTKILFFSALTLSPFSGIAANTAGTADAECHEDEYSVDTFKQVQEKVVSREPSLTYDVVPASFEKSMRRVKVKDPSSEYVLEQAEYIEKTEEIVIQEGGNAIEIIPTTFQTVSEQVLLQEESVRLEVIPATYKTISKDIVKNEAYQRIEVIPAVYETVTEEVLVREASKKLEIIPPEYETREHTIVTRDAYKALEVIQPQYKKTSYKQLIKEEGGSWKNSQFDDCRSTNPEDCEISCLEIQPAQYQDIPRQILEKPAQVSPVLQEAKKTNIPFSALLKDTELLEKPIESEYVTIERKVIKTPATTKIVEVPAEYETIEVTVVDQPAQIKEIKIPAVYSTVYKKIVKTPESAIERKLPPVTRTLVKRIISKPANYTKRMAAAKYEEFPVEVLKQASYTNTVEVLPEYTEINKAILVTRGGILQKKAGCRQGDI